MHPTAAPTRTFLALALVSSVAALSWAVPAAAQPNREEAAPPQGRFGEQLEVTEVLLDVLVTDRRGNAVIGLEPEDFVVHEGAKQVPVETATFYSSSRLIGAPKALSARGIDVDLEPRDRYFILFFHDAWRYTTGEVNLMHQQARAGRDAKAWVSEDLPPADWVAVLSWDGSLTLHQDFTRDRQAIERAIDEAATHKRGRGDWPSRRERTEGPSLAARLPHGKDLTRATRRIYGALDLVAAASAPIRGRKNLIYLGIGFGEAGAFGQYREDPRFFPGMIRALNDANVAVYPIDLLPSEVEHPFESALLELARLTGGVSTPLATDFRTPLEKVGADTRGYYLLSYRATHPPGERGFQRVRVTTENPEFQVRSRLGYSYGGAAGD